MSKKNSKRKRSTPAQPVNGQPDTLTYRCGACGRETRVRTVRTPITIWGVDIERRPTLKACPACERGVPALASPAVMSRRAAAIMEASAALGIIRGEGTEAPAA